MQTVFAEKQKTGHWMITDISGSFSLSGCTGKREDSVWKYSVLEGCQKRGCTDQFHRI